MPRADIRAMFRVQSIKSKIILLFIVFASIVLVLQVGVFQHWIGTLIMEKSEAYFQETVRQIGKRAETRIGQFEQMAVGAGDDQIVKNYLRDLSANRINYHIAKYKISHELLRLPELNAIDNLYLFPAGHAPMNIYYSKALFVSTPTIDAMDDARAGSAYASRSRAVWALLDAHSPQVSTLLDIRDEGERLGVLRIDLDESFFNSMLDEVRLGKEGKVYLARDGVIVYAQNRAYLRQPISRLNGGSNTEVRYDLNLQGWQVIGEVPNAEIRKQIRRFNNIFLLMVFLILIAILAFAMATARVTLRRLKKILKGMESVQQGNFKIALTPDSRDEFSVLIGNFNRMVERIDQLVRTVYNQQRHYREAEIRNLQAKLNPHFLYNTLDMIYWMVVMKEEEEASEAIVALSNILRYSISHQSEFVAVGEDAGQLENYLRLQSMRFEGKLAYELRIAPEILKCRIPKLLIQPLVENAVKHAFKDMQNGGMIRVVGYSDRNDVWFEVSDNGAGMSREAIQAFGESAEFHENQKGGIGLRLVHQRITYIYGEGYGLTISSEPGKGTRITAKLRRQAEHAWDGLLDIAGND